MPWTKKLNILKLEVNIFRSKFLYRSLYLYVCLFVAGRAPCDLRDVEGFYVVQRPRSYALAMPKGHPYLDEINSALLHIQVRFLFSIKYYKLVYLFEK